MVIPYFSRKRKLFLKHILGVTIKQGAICLTPHTFKFHVIFRMEITFFLRKIHYYSDTKQEKALSETELQ